MNTSSIAGTAATTTAAAPPATAVSPASPAGSSTISTTPATTSPGAAPWHESLITRHADGSETLADFTTWKDRAPAPLAKFIADNMRAARAKTDGMLRLPGAGAAAEEWEPVWKALGRPDNPEGYGVKAPDRLPEGVVWDDTAAGKFAQVAHRIGLTPAQAAALQEFQVGYVGEQTAAVRAAAQQALEREDAALKSAFGVQLPEAAAAAQRAAVDAGLPAEVFDPSSGEFWGVEALRLVHGLTTRLARLTSEDRPGGGTPGAILGGYEYAKAVSTDPRHPDYEAYRRGDPAVVRRVNDGWAQMPRG